MASEAAERFTWVRIISGVALAGMTSMVMWAGSAVVQSRQDYAVLGIQVVTLQDAAKEAKAEFRDIRQQLEALRAQIASAMRDIRRYEQPAQRREPPREEPQEWTLPRNDPLAPTFRERDTTGR